MKKYIARLQSSIVAKTMAYKLRGCSSFVVRNEGNTYVTILGYIVIAPGNFFASDPLVPGVIYHTDFAIEFDENSNIVDVPTYPGRNPILDNGTTVPSSDRDNRVLIIETFINEA